MSDLSFLKAIPDPVSPDASSSGDGGRLRRPRPAVPTRSSAERRRWAALAVSLAWLCGHLAVFGIRQDVRHLPLGYLVAQVGLPILFAAACLGVALAPGKLGLGLGVSVSGAMALLGPLGFGLLALSVPTPHAPAEGPFGFWLGSLLCFDITLSWAAAPLLLLSLSLRRAFAAQTTGRSALLGAALGLLSGAAINLHCPSVERWHMATGHAVPVLIATLLGAFLVARSTRA